MRKVLWVSAFGPEDIESASNRLRKISKGLNEAGVAVSWLYAPGARRPGLPGPWQTIRLPVSRPELGQGRIAGKIRRAALAGLYLAYAFSWALRNPHGRLIVTVPPTWLYAVVLPCVAILGKRVVLDYRDPVINRKINPRGEGFYRAVQAMERFALARAGLVAAAAPDIFRHLPAEPEKTACIYSGFDPAEIRQRTAGSGQSGRIVILYGGTFYSGRSPESLARAFHRLLEERAAGAERICFRFHTKFECPKAETEFKDLIRSLGLERYFSLLPLIGREEFLRALSEADYSLIITHDSGSEYAIPGKIFDYLTVPASMLVFSADSALENFLREFRISAIVSDPSVSGVEKGLRSVIAGGGKKTEGASRSGELSCLEQGSRFAKAIFG